MNRRPRLYPLTACLFLAAVTSLRAFHLPTANQALFEPGGEERFFAPTPGKAWTSGTFGCVRSDGHQMHEGLDIRSVRQDRRGEPVDPVMASLDGTVVYTSRSPGLSNYGKYVILRHSVEGLEVFTLYAHLSEIRNGLGAGAPVRAGEVIATMGRTSNTRSRIGKERAHVHFEINLFVNDHFSDWYRSADPGQRNDHGNWNGRNLLGVDPRLILLQERAEGTNFSLVRFIAKRTELCRVLVREKSFPWVRRYQALVARNPVAEREGVAGYEISLDLNGLPFHLIPRSLSEIHQGSRFQLLSVNAAEQERNPCRHLVTRHSGGWLLSEHAIKDLELLAY